MKKIIQYVEEFCPVCHYRCLMPVEYEEMEAGGDLYQKLACVCSKAKSGECQEGNSCCHFKSAVEQVDITKVVPL